MPIQSVTFIIFQTSTIQTDHGAKNDEQPSQKICIKKKVHCFFIFVGKTLIVSSLYIIKF